MKEMKNPPAETTMPRRRNPGEALPDGWIFLGLSPVTNRAFSLAPANFSPEEGLRPQEAVKLAEKAREQGHLNARLPMEADYRTSELLQIFSLVSLPEKNRYWMAALLPNEDVSLQGRSPGDFYANPAFSARALIVRDEPSF